MNLGKENEFTEFKETTAELKEGVKSLSSMLNKRYKGFLYFGVKNNGDVVGQQIGTRTLRDISQAIANGIEPAIIPTIEEESDERGHSYIKVEARGLDIPYSAYGQYWVRSSDEDKQITREALRKMFSASGYDFISQRESRTQKLTFDRFVSILVAKGYHIPSLNSLIESRGLRNEDGKFNLMAFILSDQSDVSIKVVRFSGTDKVSMSQNKEFGNQCLLSAIRQAMDYSLTLDENNVDLGRSENRDTPLFDQKAFQEAWINACVHNSWIDMVPPAIYFYSDRVEIVSYGGLPYGLELDDFYGGTSRPINKALWAIFNATDYAEQTGHGVPTIVSAYGKGAIKVSDNFVTVTIPFAFKPTWAYVNANKSTKLSANQKAILDAISEDPSAIAANIAKKTGLSVGTIKANIQKLKRFGLLERKGGKRNGSWLVK